MLQQDDSAGRRQWMGVLARAPLPMLEAWGSRQPQAPFTWLRPPESGLAMVRARAGGGGAKFNLGEMTVTRCALRLESGAVGVAYIAGRSHRKAELAALADAHMNTREARERVERELIEPLRVRLEAEAARQSRKAQATRVDFFTLAREAGA